MVKAMVLVCAKKLLKFPYLKKIKTG